MGVLGQAEHLPQTLQTACGACGLVALGQGGFPVAERHCQLAGQGQQVDAVLVGVQVQQYKSRVLSGYTGQQGQVVFFPGQAHRHPALALGCPHPLQRLALGQHQRARHQGQQDQQGHPQGGPETFPAFGLHRDSLL